MAKWSLFEAWRTLGEERGFHRWPLLAALGPGLLLLFGWRRPKGQVAWVEG